MQTGLTVAMALVAGGAMAQGRTMNPGAPGGLHQWPSSGKWVVELMRGDDQRLACVVLTGIRNQNEFYLWGLKRVGQDWSVIVADQNSSAVSGDHIKVIVDGTEIGDYLISKRREKSGMNSIRADMPDGDVSRFSRLLPIGGEIKLQTVSSTYSASLNGMNTALWNMGQCLDEAKQMTPSHQ